MKAAKTEMSQKSRTYLTCIPYMPFILGLTIAGQATGKEISLLNGFYQTSQTDNTGADGGKKTTISLGARYADQLTMKLHWYAEGQLALKNYGENAASVAPSDSSGLVLGGGVRHYFGKIGEHFATYVSGGGRYKSEKDGSFQGNSASTTETNGLYYGAGFGFRLYLGSDFFCDFEAPLFESALFATETTTTETNTNGTISKTDVETKKTELFVASSAPLDKAVLSLGMKL